MTAEYVSLGFYYFADLGMTDIEYCLIDPMPLPVVRGGRVQAITYNTLPGISGSTVSSGRTIYIPMGGDYEVFFPEMTFTLTDDSFLDYLEDLKDNMANEHFIFGWKVGTASVGSPPVVKNVLCKYRVNFLADGLDISQPSNPSQVARVKLINLGYLGTSVQSIP